MKIKENWYLILKWSYWKDNQQKSMVDWYKKLKEKLMEKWILKIEDWKLVFKEDYLFSSSTAPAQILLWYSVSWPEVWINKKNWKNLKNDN